MPKRTNDFQQLVLRIYQALAGTGAHVEESVLVPEKNSDAKREVDVLVTALVAGHKTRIAIECRDHTKDQDITWVDGLIGKYANLGIEKVIAVSSTDYSSTAFQKAAQHNIELLSLKEASETDWADKVGPSAFQFFGFRNRPLIVGLRLHNQEQIKLEYTFDGELQNQDGALFPYAQLFLDIWEAHMAHMAGQKIAEHVFSNWDRFTSLPNTPRYCEIVEDFSAPRTIHIENLEPVIFDQIVWGVGTKYSIELLAPRKLALGDKAASIASALDDQGTPVHITLALNQTGQLIGAHVKSGDA